MLTDRHQAPEQPDEVACSSQLTNKETRDLGDRSPGQVWAEGLKPPPAHHFVRAGGNARAAPASEPRLGRVPGVSHASSSLLSATAL